MRWVRSDDSYQLQFILYKVFIYSFIWKPFSVSYKVDFWNVIISKIFRQKTTFHFWMQNAKKMTFKFKPRLSESVWYIIIISIIWRMLHENCIISLIVHRHASCPHIYLFVHQIWRNRFLSVSYNSFTNTFSYF